jgi:nucleoredoxin
LSKKFDVNGIPAFIIVKPDGSVITKDGRSDVSSKPARAAFSAWKNQL